MNSSSQQKCYSSRARAKSSIQEISRSSIERKQIVIPREPEYRGILDVAICVRENHRGRHPRTAEEQRKDIERMQMAIRYWRPSSPGMEFIDNTTKRYLYLILEEVGVRSEGSDELAIYSDKSSALGLNRKGGRPRRN